MSKIERKYLAHYIDANIGGTTPIYVRLGKDLETYAEELNPQVSIQRNLGGEPFVHMEGYQAQSSVEPFYAEYGSLLFEVLSRIANNRITDDSCKTTKVDALLNEDGTQVWAYREDCWIVPVSIGGDTSGVQIPFNVYCAGNRVYGTFDTANKTFVETGEEPPISLFTTLSATHNGTFNAPAGKGYSQVTVSVPMTTLLSLTASANGLYSAPSGCAYSRVTVSTKIIELIERTFSGFLNDSTITRVGAHAFYGCTRMSGAVLPSCTVILSSAFGGCSRLSQISAPICGRIYEGAFEGCTELTEADFPVCSYLGSYAFDACQTLSYVSIPNCVNIEYEVFGNCGQIKSLSFPKAQKVGSYAFFACGKLETVSFGSYMSELGNYTFLYCHNIVSLHMAYSNVVSLKGTVSATFDSTPMYNYSASAGKWGTIYVPASLLTAYQADSKWGVISSRFSAI